MIAEARRRRLAELPRREAPQSRQELWIEAGFRGLHPAEIAAPRAGDRIARLFLRHVLELRRAARDLRAQAPRVGERGGRVAGVGNLGLRDEAEPRRRRTLEVVLVGRVVALQLGVGHRGERVGDLLGTDGEYGDGDRLVLIAPDAPQLRVGDVHVGREVLLQLALREVFAVQRLDLGPDLFARAAQLALPLRDVELTVRLKGRVFHDLPQDLRRRSAPRHLADLVVRHLDAEPAVFALEQNALDELVGDLVLQLLLVFATQAPAAPPARFLDRVLERRLELGGAHDLAVDLEDDVTPAAEDVVLKVNGQRGREGA